MITIILDKIEISKSDVLEISTFTKDVESIAKFVVVDFGMDEFNNLQILISPYPLDNINNFYSMITVSKNKDKL